MNILIIDNSNRITGAFKCANRLALLFQQEHRFIFLLPQQSTNDSLLQEQGYSTYKLPMQELKKSIISVLQYPFYLIANLIRLKRIVKKEQIDCVVVNDFYNLLGAALLLTGSKVVLITYVRFLPSTIPKPLRTLWTKVAQRYSHHVIAVSDAVLGQLPNHPSTIRIYDPVAIEEQLPVAPYTSGTKQLLYLSNFTKGKGQEHALKAFAAANLQDQDVRLILVGGDLGLEKNQAFRAELEREAQDLGIAHQVSFHAFESNIEQLIKDSYLLLNFSESESFSMTCLEASFYGTPVIATRCGGPEEIIDHEKTGLLVAKQDIKAMASALTSLIHNVPLRNQFAEAAKRYVVTKFTTEDFKKQFHQLLKPVS